MLIQFLLGIQFIKLCQFKKHKHFPSYSEFRLSDIVTKLNYLNNNFIFMDPLHQGPPGNHLVDHTPDRCSSLASSAEKVKDATI